MSVGNSRSRSSWTTRPGVYRRDLGLISEFEGRDDPGQGTKGESLNALEYKVNCRVDTRSDLHKDRNVGSAGVFLGRP